MVADLRAAKQQPNGRKVLYIHTGGLLGLFEKVNQLAPLMVGGWDTLG